jgi:hypothetical protein
VNVTTVSNGSRASDVDPDVTVWHYTNAEGLAGIASTRELWASAPIVLNDQTELKYGLRYLRAAWERLAPGVRDAELRGIMKEALGSWGYGPFEGEAFVFSASLDSDRLSQWLHYAGSTGFAIGLKPTEDFVPPGYFGMSHPGQNPYMALAHWRRVLYHPNEQREEVVFVLNRVLGAVRGNLASPPPGGEDPTPTLVAWAQSQLQAAALGLKNRAFVEEDEVRFVVPRLHTSNIEYRTSRGRVIPFVKVKRVGARSLEIVQVRCGPGVTRAQRTVVERFLASEGHSGAEVLRSRIPYVTV